MTRRFSNLVTSENSNQMYGGSRNGVKIDRIVIHHNATTNKNVAMSTWYTSSGNYTSAHYEVTPTEIIGCVEESYSAFHCGGTGSNDIPKMNNANERSIGIENVNSTGGPSWSVDSRTVANCAMLVRNICEYYDIPIDRKHVLAHKEVTATACPGGLNVDEVVRLAKGIGTVTQAPSKGDDEMFTIDVKYNRLGGAKVTKVTMIYEDSKLTKSTGKTVPVGSTWSVSAIENGALSIGGWISGADVILKLNPLATNSNAKVVAVVTADNLYTQKEPKDGQKGIKHLKKGSTWKVSGRVGKYLSVGGYVDGDKIKIRL